MPCKIIVLSTRTNPMNIFLLNWLNFRMLERLENVVTNINYRLYTRELGLIILRPIDSIVWPTLIIIHYRAQKLLSLCSMSLIIPATKLHFLCAQFARIFRFISGIHSGLSQRLAQELLASRYMIRVSLQPKWRLSKLTEMN